MPSEVERKQPAAPMANNSLPTAERGLIPQSSEPTDPQR